MSSWFLLKTLQKEYLLRYAEKLTGDDTMLTTEGNKRSDDLMMALNKEI